MQWTQLSRILVAALFPVMCVADPDPYPLPIPEAEAEPQSYTNNAPFSGAIYIVNPNGQEITTAGANACPNYASLSCASMGAPSWCCPSSYTCASPANSGGLIGCCPAGSSCGGTVNAAAITTVTVTVQQIVQQQTSYVYVQSQPSTVVYTAVVPASSQVIYQGGFCSTLTMSGPGLPTTGQGSCGTILIVNASPPSYKAIGYGLGASVMILHLVLGRMFGIIRWV